MHKSRIILISILYISILTITVFGSEPDTSTDLNKTDAVLLRIKNATSEIVTLTGDFIQKKKVEILKNMPDSRGKFFYKKPDCLRWEIIEPVKMGFTVNGNQGKKWREKADRYRKFDVSREPIIGVISSQVFAWAKGDFEKLRKNYKISILNESPIEVKLEPLHLPEKKYIASIVLRFSGTDNYAEYLEINETAGGSTQITFFNMVINTRLEEDIF